MDPPLTKKDAWAALAMPFRLSIGTGLIGASRSLRARPRTSRETSPDLQKVASGWQATTGSTNRAERASRLPFSFQVVSLLRPVRPMKNQPTDTAQPALQRDPDEQCGMISAVIDWHSAAVNAWPIAAWMSFVRSPGKLQFTFSPLSCMAGDFR